MTPTTYVCPKIAGSVATGVVFLGVVVLMLIPSPDHSQPYISESSLGDSSEPEAVTPSLSPSIESRPQVVARAETKPPVVPEPESTPAAEAVPSESESPPADTPPAEEAPAAEEPSEPTPVVRKEPVPRDNVLEVFDGEARRVKGGDEFVFRTNEGKSFEVKLAGVFSPKSGVGRISSMNHLREILTGPTHVQAIGKERSTWTGWVNCQGIEINEAVIAAGMAWYDPTTAQADELKQAEERARAAGIGVWEDPEAESPFKAQVEALEAQSGPAEEAAAEQGPPDSDDSAQETAADSQPVAVEQDKPEAPSSQPPPQAATQKVEVDQSSPDKLIATFVEALKHSDLTTAQGLISSRPFGYARRFREGELTDSAIANIRETFDGATIRDIRTLYSKVNVLMTTAAGKDFQVIVVQEGADWTIHTWELPR